MVTLIIHEQRESLIPILLDVFQAVQNVEVVCCDRRVFRRQSDLDALLLPHPVAYELLGGLPAQEIYEFTPDSLHGRVVTILDAQLVSAAERAKQPPFPIDWVVTGPTFPADVSHGGQPFKIALRDSSLTPEIQDYVIFARALQVIHRRNASGGTAIIRRVGCTLDDFSIATGSEDTNLRELQAIRQACLDYRVNTTASETE